MKKRVAAFACVILRGSNPAPEILAVRRSPHDRYFPDLWGIPAGTLRKREGYEGAIQRSAHHRLGIEVEVLGERGAGSSDRGTHVLDMRLYEVRIVAGSPHVRAIDPDGHGYVDVRWENPDILTVARERGSLCCRLVDEWLRTTVLTPERFSPPTSDERSSGPAEPRVPEPGQ
jgi:ADP-ribose pyrophosphatase YjhB (NUDIX family)